MRSVPELSHADAMRLIEGVRSELERDGLGATVVVADAHGELIALLRTDGCPLPSITNACNKAFTAARERTESANIGKKSRTDGFALTNFGDLRYTGWGGGVPLVIEGHVVGAIGISGLPEESDIRLARQAAELLTGA